MLEQRELTGERLAGGDRWPGRRRPARRRQMSDAAASGLARPDAARVIVGSHRWSWRVGDMRSRSRSADARQDPPRALRRHRRHRHERHRRAAGEPGLRRERVRRQAIGDRPAAGEPFGVRVHRGTRGRTRRRRRRRGVLVGRARRRTRRSSRRSRRGIPVDPARRDAGRADAAPVLDRGRRVARQDDDDVDGRARARARGARSDGGDRRPAERVRQQRAARTAASTWWPRPTRATGRS